MSILIRQPAAHFVDLEEADGLAGAFTLLFKGPNPEIPSGLKVNCPCHCRRWATHLFKSEYGDPLWNGSYEVPGLGQEVRLTFERVTVTFHLARGVWTSQQRHAASSPEQRRLARNPSPGDLSTHRVEATVMSAPIPWVYGKLGNPAALAPSREDETYNNEEPIPTRLQEALDG